MSVLSVPANKNFLSPLGFKFSLVRSPNLNFSIQSVRLPGIKLEEVDIPNPFVRIPSTGGIIYDPFSITFRVSEDLDDYLELYNWMVGLGAPDSFDQYKRLQNATPGNPSGVLSDMTLIVMNSVMKSNIKISFRDGFPINLGDLEFNTTDNDVNYIQCTAEFKYLKYDIEFIN